MRFLPTPRIKIRALIKHGQPQFADATSTWFTFSPEHGGKPGPISLEPYAAQRLDTGETLDPEPWRLVESQKDGSLEKQLKARGVRVFSLSFDGGNYSKRAARYAELDDAAAANEMSSRKEFLLAVLGETRGGKACGVDLTARRTAMEEALTPFLDKLRDGRQMTLDLYNSVLGAGSIRLMFRAGERVVPLDVELSLRMA